MGTKINKKSTQGQHFQVLLYLWGHLVIGFFSMKGLPGPHTHIDGVFHYATSFKKSPAFSHL